MAAMARAWRDAGRFYRDVNTEDFQVPDEDGLEDWLASGVEAMDGDRDLGLLVAENGDGEVMAFAAARLVHPAPDAPWQLQREMATVRLILDAVAVAEPYRGSGVGTALASAAEAWGRERGAEIAVADGNWDSGLVPVFYERHLGYRKRSISLRKRLAD